MSSFILKLFAIIFMLIDHIGAVFFSENLIFRIIGRLAFPIFAFQIGIGYSHTKNKVKHIGTLLVFALISQIPFYMMCSINSTDITLNVLFTFLFAILIIYSGENIKQNIIKIPLIAILFLTVIYIKPDYGICGVVLTILLYYFSNHKVLITPILLFVMALHCYINQSSPIQLFSILASIFILSYNGKKGTNAKWLFYVFYPLHIMLLAFLYKLLN